MTVLIHIAEESAWEAAVPSGVYAASSLETEEFIHLSHSEQIAGVAARFYRGREGLVLLVIDADKLTSPVRFESVANHGTFPHLYGPLNTDAVIKVLPFDPGDAMAAVGAI